MFGVLSWFGEVRITSLYSWVLVAMAQLALQSGVSGSLVIFGFRGTLRRILVEVLMIHESQSML